MPGIDLNLDLPTLADPFATVLSKLIEAIEAIESDLAPRIPAGALDITTNLSMGGAALLNVGGVRLIGGESDEIGTLFMDEEFSVVTPSGVVQITSNGGLNIASTGTIGGDYGGVNPAAVEYNDASGEYRFMQDVSPLEWADVACADVILEGTNGSIRLSVDDAISTARTLKFKSLPASGISLLAYNAADSTVEDAATVTISGDVTFTTLKATSRTIVIGPAEMQPRNDGGLGATMGTSYTWTHSIAGASSIYCPIRLPAGAIIGSVSWKGYKASATGTISASLRRNATNGSGDVLITTLGSNNSNNPGAISLTASSIAHTVLASNAYYVQIFTSGVSGDDTFAVEVTYSGVAL